MRSKSFLSLLLVLLLTLNSLPAVFAEDTDVFNVGDFNCRLLSDGTIEIAGRRRSFNFTGKSYTVPDVIDGKMVTSIGECAFRGEYFSSLTIPDGITSIGIEAFRNCDQLRSVYIADSVTTISVAAFFDCYHLESVSLPNGITSLDNYIFAECPNLRDIAIPEGVISIGTYAFNNCSALTNVTLPESLNFIKSSAFANCWRLCSINLPSQVICIGSSAFAGTGLQSISLPSSVQEIDEFAFSTNKLQNITITGYIPWLDSNAFYIHYDSPMLITMPITMLPSISSAVRSDSTMIWYQLSIPADYQLSSSEFDFINSHYVNCVVDSNHPTLESIDGVLFSKEDHRLLSYSLRLGTSYAVPDGTLAISEHAFNIQSVENITIPDSVAAIACDAFIGNSAMKSFIVSPTHSIFADIDGVLFNKTEKSLIAFPCNYNDSSRYSISYEVPNGINSINSYAFANTAHLSRVAVPDSVTSIGAYAFANSSSLASITLPESITAIEAGTFTDCENLSSVNIPGNTTSIGECAFQNCTSLTSLTIPSSVTLIGENAFKDCTALTLTVTRNSYAADYAKSNNISYAFTDANDWLNN